MCQEDFFTENLAKILQACLCDGKSYFLGLHPLTKTKNIGKMIPIFKIFRQNF